MPDVRRRPIKKGSTGLFVQIRTYKFGSKIEDVEDRLNELLELVRRYDEANGTNPVPDQVKKGVHYLENARATEDTSSAECGYSGKLQRITRGD